MTLPINTTTIDTIVSYMTTFFKHCYYSLSVGNNYELEFTPTVSAARGESGDIIGIDFTCLCEISDNKIFIPLGAMFNSSIEKKEWELKFDDMDELFDDCQPEINVSWSSESGNSTKELAVGCYDIHFLETANNTEHTSLTDIYIV